MIYQIALKSRLPSILMHNLDNAFRRSPEKIEMEKLTLASAKAKKEPANIERMAWHGEAGKFYQGTAGQCLAGRGMARLG